MNIIKEFEGCFLESYLCPAKVWTIGYGSTIHPNGRKVAQGDKITQDQAEQYLQIEIDRRSAAMALPDTLKPNQVEALVSFAFNLGLGAWNKSTLKKKVLLNPSDPTIRDEFMKWDKAGGKVLRGLTRRRKAEADLYFS
jgi:lysozyme